MNMKKQLILSSGLFSLLSVLTLGFLVSIS